MQGNRRFQKSKRPPISRLVVDFLDLHAPVTFAPAAIETGLDLVDHFEAVRAALKRAHKRGEIAHDGYGRWRSLLVKPRDVCRCPHCGRVGLRKFVEVTIDAPAQCRALDKNGIRSPDVAVMAAHWEHERYHCRKCGWSSRSKKGERR